MKLTYRIATLALLASSALAVTAPASAKELAAVRVCGAAGCRQISDRGVLRELIRTIEAQDEAVRARSPAPAPFLRIGYFARPGQRAAPDFTQYYIPVSARLAVQIDPGTWTWVEAGSLRALLGRITAGVRPYAEPAVTRVLVAGRPVRDPASYVRLFSLRATTNDYPANGDWVAVRIETEGASPWSTGAATLEYSPGKDVLWRGTELLKVPSATASALEARESLARVPADGPFPWAALAGGMGAAALAVPAAWLVRRRRKH